MHATRPSTSDWSKLFHLRVICHSIQFWFFLVPSPILLLLLLVCAHLCTCMWTHMHGIMWKPEDSIRESVLSFHLPMGSTGLLRWRGLSINCLTWWAISPKLWFLSFWNSDQTNLWLCGNKSKYFQQKWQMPGLKRADTVEHTEEVGPSGCSIH